MGQSFFSWVVGPDVLYHIWKVHVPYGSQISEKKTPKVGRFDD